VLWLAERHKAFDAEFASHAGKLPTAERRLEFARIIDVDTNRATFELLRKGPRSLKVLSIDVRSKAIGQRVGDFESFPVVANFSNGGDRAVGFLRHDPRRRSP